MREVLSRQTTANKSAAAIADNACERPNASAETGVSDRHHVFAKVLLVVTGWIRKRLIETSPVFVASLSACGLEHGSSAEAKGEGVPTGMSATAAVAGKPKYTAPAYVRGVG
jgi:hypothetical protein